MFNLLKVEFYKLRKFAIFYAALLLIGIVGFIYGYLKFEWAANINDVFVEDVRDTSFMFIISVVSAWFIGNDFGNRTITNEIKLGFNRNVVVFVRWIMAGIIAVVFHSAYILFTILGYSVVHGTDTSVFCLRNFFWFMTIILQLYALEGLIVFICFLARKIAGAISISVISIVILCNVLRNYLDQYAFFKLSCFSMAQTGSVEVLYKSAVYAAVTIAALLTLTFICFRKADIQ